MLQKMLRMFSHHTWALGAVHIAIVTILFAVFLSVPPIVAMVASFSQLPEDLRTMLYLLVLALLGGTYATLVLALTARHQREQYYGPRTRAALIGVWQGADRQFGQAAGRVTLAVAPDDDDLALRLTTVADRGVTATSLRITDLEVGDLVVLHSTAAPDAHGRSDGSAGGWRLELVFPSDQEPYMIARAATGSPDGVWPGRTDVILRRLESGL